MDWLSDNEAMLSAAVAIMVLAGAAVEVMPFNVEEYLEFDVPGSDSVGDWGR